MSLHDLHAVFVSTQNACKSINACGDLSLSKEFKESYADLIKNEPSFSRHNEAVWLANDILELHSRGNRTVTYIPSVFFFVAQKLVPLYLELQAYRAALVQVLQPYNHTLDDTEEPNCVPYIDKAAFLSDEEKHWLCKFVTDGSWWGKGRQIKRAQDFYESPLMQCASLTQETQSEVARITKQFAENPTLVSKLAVTKNLFADKSSNADPLTIALCFFKAHRNEFVEGLKINDGVRAYFDPLTPEKLRAYTQEQFEELFLGKEKYEHMWAGTNGKGWGHIQKAGRGASMNFIASICDKAIPAEQFCDKGFAAPSGFGPVVVAELNLKFHPTEYCAYSKRTAQALEILGLKKNTYTSGFTAAEYTEVLKQTEVVRDKMESMGIGLTREDDSRPDYLSANEFIDFVCNHEDELKKQFSKDEPELPKNVDRLTLALKQFQEARKTTGSTDVRYWIFSPGERACRWDEMRDGGVMALSYSECGRDLREYADEEAIRAEFKSSEEDDASYKNHVRALTDFLNVMKPGDLVFAKKGTKTFLGVGRVTGEYEFAADASDYKHRRAIEWLKVETIERDDAVARKTLTDVTRYGDLVRELCEAYEVEGVANADEGNWGCQDVRDWFDAFTPEKLKEDFAYFRSRMLWSRRVQGTIGREYAHIDELGVVMKELKDSPRPIGYYASEEFLKKCPDGFGKSTATDFLMKFHPNEYISFTGNMMDALDFLGLWPKDVKREIDVCYNELIGAATRVRNRMKDLEVGRFPEGKKPEADYFTVNEFLWWVDKHKDSIKEEIMANTYKKTEIKKVDQQPIDDFSDFIKKLEKDVAAVGLKYAPDLMKRFVCAQLAKPFVVLTGLSGSGKTKLAQAFTTWIAVENSAKLVPVGADWTNSEKLLGYPNALDKGEYVMPDTGVLRFILDAALPENKDLPFFLVLDEMNLSHVERYFADFLSAMESGDKIKLYDGEQRYSSDGMAVPRELAFPKNLFVIGTMNVDETTYMFSPKVLDRAQVIEFRVSEDDMKEFLENPSNPNMASLSGKGAQFAEAFLALASKRGETKPEDPAVATALKEFFKPLAELGAEFGYRSAIEILSFCGYYMGAGAGSAAAIDAAIVQKLLPKVHGSRRKLEEVLIALWNQCLAESKELELDKAIDAKPRTVINTDLCKYPLSAEKVFRMRKASLANGFASFAEA